MTVGVNYIVKGQSPQCGDYSTFEQRLKDNFNNKFVRNLCRADYKYHEAQSPNKYFYTLDLVGNLNGKETKFRDWIEQALLKAWTSKYPGSLSSLSFSINIFLKEKF